MSTSTESDGPRKLIAWVVLSIDGYAAGPGNGIPESQRTPATNR
jgi:hypothetical protein